MQAIDSANLGPAPLRAKRIEGVYRVAVNETAKNFVGTDLAVGVQRDAIIFFHRQRLQTIHVVGHGHRAVTVAGIEMQKIIPGCAGFHARGSKASSVCKTTSLAEV